MMDVCLLIRLVNERKLKIVSYPLCYVGSSDEVNGTEMDPLLDKCLNILSRVCDFSYYLAETLVKDLVIVFYSMEENDWSSRDSVTWVSRFEMIRKGIHGEPISLAILRSWLNTMDFQSENWKNELFGKKGKKRGRVESSPRQPKRRRLTTKRGRMNLDDDGKEFDDTVAGFVFVAFLCLGAFFWLVGSGNRVMHLLPYLMQALSNLLLAVFLRLKPLKKLLLSPRESRRG